jgi:tRNA-dihydrouridine synthase 4
MHREPADYDAIKLIKSSLNIPVYANGGCNNYEDALNIALLTGADGMHFYLNVIINFEF